jgi:class I fructose-bisphosphate aldolase
MEANLNRITTKGKTVLLAYDHGIEHGPTDFDDRNVDPAYIMDIAKKGGYNGIVFQKGVAEKYYDKSVPLIVKLNGKTSLLKGDPVSVQLCSVKEAMDLGAVAVGYTIYVGSIHENEMFKEFEEIQGEARKNGMPVVCWMYPRGAAVKDESSRETLAYAARIGLELGADMLKMKYNGNVEDMKWIVKSAGRAKVVIAGGSKRTEREFLQEAHDAMKAGCIGLAVGRNIWNHPHPMKMTAALKKVVFSGASVDEALKEVR